MFAILVHFEKLQFLFTILHLDRHNWLYIQNVKPIQHPFWDKEHLDGIRTHTHTENKIVKSLVARIPGRLHNFNGTSFGKLFVRTKGNCIKPLY